MADDKSKPKLTLEQRIQRQRDALERLERLKAERSRKFDTRKKIVVGGTVIAAMEADAELRARVAELLARTVTRELDRQVVAEWLPTI